MKRHPFDPVSFLFGALFTSIAFVYLIGSPGEVTFGRRWIVPALLVVGGLAVLASTRRTLSIDARTTVIDPDTEDESPANDDDVVAVVDQS